jgi:hypothetical protein
MHSVTVMLDVGSLGPGVCAVPGFVSQTVFEPGRVPQRTPAQNEQLPKADCCASLTAYAQILTGSQV